MTYRKAGTPDKKQMPGHSVATYQGKDIPFVRADFSAVKAARYQRHPAAQHKVMGMWCAYYAAYQDKAAVQQARLALEKTNARILMIAGQADGAWPAANSVQQMEQELAACSYPKDVRAILFPHGSHLCGMMPNRAREKWLYRMVPLIGLMYKSFGKYRHENFSYFAQSEREIIAWVKQEGPT